jgi:hypothetical protein
MSRKTLFTILLAGAALLPAGALQAQSSGGYPQTREGFWFTGGLGYGSLGCKDCSDRTGGLSGTLALGGTISQNFQLGVGTTGWTRSENGATLSAGTLAATLRFYPSATSGFFLRGDLGVGRVDLAVNGFGRATQTTSSAAIGVGYDIRIAPMVSLTPYLNVVGMSWNGGDANYSQIGLAITTH